MAPLPLPLPLLLLLICIHLQNSPGKIPLSLPRTLPSVGASVRPSVCCTRPLDWYHSHSPVSSPPLRLNASSTGARGGPTLLCRESSISCLVFSARKRANFGPQCWCWCVDLNLDRDRHRDSCQFAPPPPKWPNVGRNHLEPADRLATGSARALRRT